jgi:DNA polymerase I
MYLTSTADVEKIVPEIEAMPIIGVDTETTGLDPFESDLLLLQLGNLDKQYVIDARQCSLEPLRPVLEGSKVKVLHNAKFDYKMLKAIKGIRMENLVDTMLIEQVLRNGRRAEGGNGLAAVVERYTRKKVSKEEQTSFIGHTGDFTQAQLEYARRDVIYPLEVLHKQMPLVRKAKLEHTVKLECLAVTAIADIELNGVAIDQERWMKIAQQAEEEAAKAQKLLDIEFEPYIEQRGELVLFEARRAINYDSDKQLREALSFLGIEVDSTSKAVLSSLDHEEYPAAKLILEYRQHQKIVSTYGATFLEHIHPKTGRIHCDFRQMGAESGRMSCTKPNLQNIPSDSEFRSCFIAGPERKVITADYSGCELRILADMSQDPEFLRAFRNNEDLHSLVATMMFKVPVSKSENKELRQAAKAINFGLAYGMSSKGLAAQIGCPDEEAEDLLQKYFAGYPKIASFLEKAGRIAISRGYATTIGGRRRYFDMTDIDQDRRKKGSIERKGKNSPIQGTNADMIKLALFRLREELHARNVDAALVNTVHDEVVVECDAAIAVETQELIEKVMRAAGEYYVKSVPVDVESAIEDCWSK